MKTTSLFIGAVLIFGLVAAGVYLTMPQVEQATAGQALELDFINDNLLSGGVRKDGIPAIDHPKFISAEEAKLNDDDQVFGIVYNNEARAYPSLILYQHEIVNDKFDDQEVSVTYCPLTGTVLGFKDINLGVSGKLFNSNLVMYDRATDSYIPQIIATGVSGPLKGQELTPYPITTTTWKLWKEKYPDTKVLSRDTGFQRNYDDRPYPGYEDALRVWFPTVAQSDKFHSKKVIHGIENNNEFIAIPKEEFKEEKTILLGGDNIQVIYNQELNAIETYKDGERLPSFDTYWFAWYAYHPDTKILES